MSTVDPNLFKTLVETSPEAVALCEAESGHWNVTYVNPDDDPRRQKAAQR